MNRITNARIHAGFKTHELDDALDLPEYTTLRIECGVPVQEEDDSDEDTDMTTQTTTITRRSVLRIDWQWRAEWKALSANQIRELPRVSPAQAVNAPLPAWARGGASPGGLGVDLTIYHRGRRLDWDGGEQGSLWDALRCLVEGHIDELEWPYAEE